MPAAKYVSDIPAGAREIEIKPTRAGADTMWLRRTKCLVAGALVGYRDYWKNGLLATPQIFAQPRVPSFSTVDLSISRTIRLDHGGDMELYFSVQNIGNQTPPIVTGSSGNPGAGIQSPAGEDIMGRFFTIGVRGNL